MLGATDRDAILNTGRAAGLVRYLMAVPALEDKGRVPLLDGREVAIAALARDALENMPRKRPNNPACLEAWQAVPLLRQIAKQPWRVAQDRVGLSPFRKKLRLLRWS